MAVVNGHIAESIAGVTTIRDYAIQPQVRKGHACVMDLDWASEMIIFKSILTTYKSSIIFSGSFGSSVNWLELKIKPLLANLACTNLRNTLYVLNVVICDP